MAQKATKPSGWYKDVKTYKSGAVMYRLLYDGEVIIEASRESTIDILLAKRTGG
jgi:hypothetical protein